MSILSKCVITIVVSSMLLENGTTETQDTHRVGDNRLFTLIYNPESWVIDHIRGVTHCPTDSSVDLHRLFYSISRLQFDDVCYFPATKKLRNEV